MSGASDDRLARAHELLIGQVTTLTSSREWRAMLEAARWFHDYSPRNVLLLMAQGAQGHVAGYRAWQHIPAHDGANCQVAHGAQGHLILAPMHRVARYVDQNGEERTQHWLRGFKVVTVFDETQLVAPPAVPEVRPRVLEGMAPPQLSAGLIENVRARDFTLAERDIAPAFGRTDFAAREVAIRPGLAPAAYTKTLAHETAHVLLHDPTQGSSIARSRERDEVEAESVAYLVAAAAGLDTGVYSFPYIARWAGGDLDLVRKTAERSVAAARELTNALGTRLALALATPAAQVADGSLHHGQLGVMGPDVAPELLDRFERDVTASFQWLERNPAAWGATPRDLEAVRGILGPEHATDPTRSVGIGLD